MYWMSRPISAAVCCHVKEVMILVLSRKNTQTIQAWKKEWRQEDIRRAVSGILRLTQCFLENNRGREAKCKKSCQFIFTHTHGNIPKIILVWAAGVTVARFHSAEWLRITSETVSYFAEPQNDVDDNFHVKTWIGLWQFSCNPFKAVRMAIKRRW